MGLDLLRTRYGLIHQRRAWRAGKLRAVAAHPVAGVAVAGYGRRVLLMSEDLEQVLARIRLPESVRTLAFSPDGSRLAIAVTGVVTRVFEIPPEGLTPGLEAPRLFASFQARGTVNALVFLSGGLLACACDFGKASIWDLDRDAENHFSSGDARLVGICRSGPGRVAVAAEDGTVAVHDDVGREIVREPTGVRTLSVLAADRHSARLAVAGAEGRVAFLDRARLRRFFTATLPNGWAMSLGISPDGHEVAVGCKDGNVQLLDTRVGDVVATIPVWYPELGDAADVGVAAVAYLASGRLAVVHGSKRVGIWEPRRLDAWTLLRTFAARRDVPSELARLVSATADEGGAEAILVELGREGREGNPYRVGMAESGIAARFRAAVERAVQEPRSLLERPGA